MKPRMQTQMIVRMPSSNLDNLPSEITGQLQIIGQVSGSITYYSKIIVLALSKLNKGELTSLFKANDLSWSVLAEEHKPVNLKQISKFTSDPLQCVGGHKWL